MVIRGKGGNKIGKETTFFLSHWKRNHLQTLHVGAQVSSSLMGLALAGFLGVAGLCDTISFYLAIDK